METTYSSPSPRTLKHTRGALGPGAEVWFVPHASAWTSKIDWHLNFQFSRIQHLRTKAPAVSVVSEKVFPTQQVIQLPPLKPQAWASRMYNIWQSLGQPRARVFLPPALKAHDFKSLLNLAAGAFDKPLHLIDLIDNS